MDRFLFVTVPCLVFWLPLVSSSFYYGFQTYDKRALGYDPHRPQVYNLPPPYREITPLKPAKPRYDFVSRPSFDYSVTYGYQPTLSRTQRHEGAKSSIYSSNQPTPKRSFSTYDPYTHSTGGYKTPSYGGYAPADKYGYQTRTTYPYPPMIHHNVQPYGREGKEDEEEYEYTSFEDFTVSKEDKDPRYRSDYDDNYDDISTEERSYDLTFSRHYDDIPGLASEEGDDNYSGGKSYAERSIGKRF